MRRSSAASMLPLLLIPVIALAAAGLLYTVLKKSSADDAVVKETVSRLKAMEEADVSEVEAAISVAEELPLARVLEPSERKDLEERIVNGYVLDDVSIRQAFRDTAILGDSITESIWEYGYLDQDVVISKMGLSVANADEQFATAISMAPSVIFMNFGSNDLEFYEENYEQFIDAYREQIHKVKEALPNARLFINLIIPLTEGAIEEIPVLANYPRYNEALKALCEEEGMTWIDDSFIVEADPSLYEPDGQHVVMSFYPQWLTYMAEVAGLV